MGIGVAIGLVVVVLLLVLVLRSGKRDQPRGRPVATRGGTRVADGHAAPAAGTPQAKRKLANKGGPKFQGQVFVAGDERCAAAASVNRKTYEKGQAPVIPLPQCDYKNCSCTTRDTDDRRHGERRIATDRRTDIRFDDERRSGRDRRKGVGAWSRPVD